MQRLAEKIYREFSSSCKYVEILVLDGNGDNFQVYQGHVSDISSHNFSHILRDAGCFYFFQVSSIPDLLTPAQGPESTIIRRDLCWLTDPSPPAVEEATATSISIYWEPVRFCGIQPPAKVDSIQYCIDIAEGIEWKETAMAKYINDAMVAPSSYRTVFRGGSNETSFNIPNLKAATWYHIRLSIEYLGVRVTSTALNVPTGRSVPGTPTTPRVTLVPIRSSFDLKSVLPARYEFLITWNAVLANGSPIDRYQVQLQRLDMYRQVVNEDPPVTTMTRPSTSATNAGGVVTASDLNEEARGKHSHAFMNEMKAIAILTSPANRKANQWISSPGRSEVQIRNSMQSRGRTISLDELQPVRSPKRRSASPTTSSSFVVPNKTNNQKTNNNASDTTNLLENSPVSAIWRIIYDNLNRSVRLASPKPTDAIWCIRARAHNREGWSAFSPILELSWKTHPNLFVARPVQLPPQQSLSLNANNSNSNNNTNNNTARTEESQESQRSHRSVHSQHSSRALQPLTPSHNNNNNGSHNMMQEHPQNNLKESTPRIMNNANNSSTNNNGNDNSHGLNHNGSIPNISTSYEYLVEKNATSTSLMLGEHSGHTPTMDSARAGNNLTIMTANAHINNGSTSNSVTPTSIIALQQHRLQQLQEHIQHNSHSNHSGVHSSIVLQALSTSPASSPHNNNSSSTAVSNTNNSSTNNLKILALQNQHNSTNNGSSQGQVVPLPQISH